MKNLYFNRYLKFIDWCDARPLFGDERTQVHHILPRCFGGDNSPDNLITLTVREHIMAHRLLALAFPNNRDLCVAYFLMVKGNMSTKEQEYLRTSLKGEKHPMFGATHSKEAKEKMSKARKGKKLSPKAKAAVLKVIKSDRNPRLGKIHSSTSKRKISASRKGKCTGESNCNYDNTTRLFVHNDLGQRECTTWSLLKEFEDLTPSNMRKVVQGERRHHKGWRCLCLL